jgi:hypothetical protein
MIPSDLSVSEGDVEAFCRKWRIVELDLFGSALGADFRSDSDVDLLVVYADEAQPTLFDEGRMQNELEVLFDRPVHFMTKRAVESSGNPIRRKAILDSATPIYVESA